MVWPFQLYGNWLVQIVVFVVLVSVAVTVKLRVAMESQPAIDFRFAVSVPAVCTFGLFQLYGNWLVQIVVLVVLVNVGVTARLRVAMESQPAIDLRFAV